MDYRNGYVKILQDYIEYFSIIHRVDFWKTIAEKYEASSSERFKKII